MRLLSICSLQIGFGDRQVVDLEALDLEEGEILGLAGESGAGKSLTALAVLGLAGTVGAWVRGSIRLDGRELVGLPEAALRALRGGGVAMIFQSPSAAFNPVFRVGQVFARALRLHGVGRAEAAERARTALRSVLLAPELLGRYPSQLSGGQLQRVAIALALALRSRLLLADEPTSALDVTVQAEILALLRDLRDREGLAVLFISHDLAVIAELCDRVAVMRDGRLVESGPTGAVLAHPAHGYTRELLRAVPRIDAAAGGGG
jgi:ABC-type glutathione transport system ATPase component